MKMIFRKNALAGPNAREVQHGRRFTFKLDSTHLDIKHRGSATEATIMRMHSLADILLENCTVTPGAATGVFLLNGTAKVRRMSYYAHASLDTNEPTKSYVVLTEM